MLSKTKNISVLTLYNSSDDKKVTLSEIFAKAVQELQFLENEEIVIKTPSAMMRLYFALAGFIGDNLASHTMLGFLKSFSSNHPCRFCLLHSKDIKNIFNASSCEIRTVENYEKDLAKNNSSEIGLSGPSALTHYRPRTTIF